ncbi:MerR family transcriptional regulator [Novosphingobium pokkalii]|uniref:MerR family transcriptional regulator n=2 Tax=Novosphingobium pokkalii TaxID=1770194 RepID=A0ABV7V1X4_9SPHN|nr:MerR family transcriptional regulator [Novosphingobium pokkalii]GHC90622.1 hypothetical protein GCM10019060_15130 [Novosphingobium pokkalii]
MDPAHQHEQWMPLADVVAATGLRADLLRAWERRYGFPVPARDDRGRRCFAPEQLDRLRLLRRLIDAGARAGAVVPLPLPQLAALAEQQSLGDARLAIGLDADVQAALTLAEQGHSVALAAHLAACLARRGAADFVMGLAAPLLIAIGEAWHAGRIAVHQEHLASEILARTLGAAALALQAGADRRAAPVAVLATLPEESHGLGLAMLEVTLAAQGGLIINLGTQLPPAQLAEAAAHHRAQVVAVSFSSFFRPAAVAPLLGALRRGLPSATALWAGGGCAGLDGPLPEGVTRFSSLGQAADAWRRQQALG